MLWFYTKLKYFGEDDRTFLVITITEQVFNTLATADQNELKHLFSFIGPNTTQASLTSVVDYCKEVFLEGKGPFIFVINEGEDGEISETKDPNTTSDYTGKQLVIREDATNTLIGQVPGTADPTQVIPYVGFPLAKAGIYRLRVQLENRTNEGQANGDGTLLLSTAYVIVPLKIDSNTA